MANRDRSAKSNVRCRSAGDFGLGKPPTNYTPKRFRIRRNQTSFLLLQKETHGMVRRRSPRKKSAFRGSFAWPFSRPESVDTSMAGFASRRPHPTRQAAERECPEPLNR